MFVYISSLTPSYGFGSNYGIGRQMDSKGFHFPEIQSRAAGTRQNVKSNHKLEDSQQLQIMDQRSGFGFLLLDVLAC